MCPEPASEREDLVYFEHKSFSKLCKEHDGEFTGEEEGSAHALERKSDNPLDIAVTRLLPVPEPTPDAQMGLCSPEGAPARPIPTSCPSSP